jgi:hypothetical protein
MNTLTKRGGRLMLIDQASRVVYCPPDFIQHVSRDALRALAQTPLDIDDIVRYESSQRRNGKLQ